MGVVTRDHLGVVMVAFMEHVVGFRLLAKAIALKDASFFVGGNGFMVNVVE